MGFFYREVLNVEIVEFYTEQKRKNSLISLSMFTRNTQKRRILYCGERIYNGPVSFLFAYSYVIFSFAYLLPDNWFVVYREIHSLVTGRLPVCKNCYEQQILSLLPAPSPPPNAPRVNLFSIGSGQFLFSLCTSNLSVWLMHW